MTTRMARMKRSVAIATGLVLLALMAYARCQTLPPGESPLRISVDVSLVVCGGEGRVHQEQVLLLAQPVRLLLVDSFRVGLEVCVLLCLEARACVDLVCVDNWHTDTGEDVAVDL